MGDKDYGMPPTPASTASEPKAAPGGDVTAQTAEDVIDLIEGSLGEPHLSEPGTAHGVILIQDDRPVQPHPLGKPWRFRLTDDGRKVWS